MLGRRVDVEVIVREVREHADLERPHLRETVLQRFARHFEHRGSQAARVRFTERRDEPIEVERMIEPLFADEVTERGRANDGAANA